MSGIDDDLIDRSYDVTEKGRSHYIVNFAEALTDEPALSSDRSLRVYDTLLAVEDQLDKQEHVEETCNCNRGACGYQSSINSTQSEYVCLGL